MDHPREELETEHPPSLNPLPILAKILIADDEPRNLLAVSEILSGPGIELVLVSSGEEALRHILRDDFAVILLDVQMPRIDGYEVAGMIRARERSSRVPILFMTAYNKDELHVFRGYSAGAVDYVFKPIEPLILKSKVSVFVELYRTTQELKRQHAAEKELLLENLSIRSEKLNAERALRRGEEHQSLVLRGLPLVHYSADLNDPGRRLRFKSNGIESIIGTPREAFETAGFWEQGLHPDDHDRVMDELRGIDTEGAITIEYRWCHSNGSERHILDRAVVIRDEDGVPREIFGMWLDMTEQREIEHRLLHASKLEAVGQLTGGIAHDFNNMLCVVMGSLDLLQKAEPGSERARRYIDAAVQGAKRCADLTGRLLAFSRRSPLQATVLRLEDVMPNIIELLRRTLGERVDVRLEMAPELPPIQVDQSQLESALVNLAVNARDAMPDGGALTLGVRRVDIEETQRIEIAITDSGVGMTPAVLRHVFEPFFTTKQIGKGTGLGLSMVYGFVQQSGGEVAIESTPGVGTTIRITFPAYREQMIASGNDPEHPSTEPINGNGLTALVVEDELSVREIATETLETLGFHVVQAETGERALELLERNDDIRLVFSDVKMPGSLSGIELGGLVKARWPNIMLLLTSAFVETEDDILDYEFLQKPYLTTELADKLRGMFATNSAEMLPTG